MKLIHITLLLFGLTSTSYASEGEPIDQFDIFFSDFANDSHRAVDNLYSSSPIMKQKIQAISLMKNQLTTIGSLYGGFLGYETIEQEELSPSLVRISVLAKYQFHPLTWEFYFYKPNSSWIPTYSIFVDNYQNIGSKK